jgi:hypothetical protein
VPDRAFNLGHRNYVTKPFTTPERLARIRAVLRRSCVQRERLSWGEMEVDFDARYVTVRGKEVHLTPKEFGGMCTKPSRDHGAWAGDSKPGVILFTSGDASHMIRAGLA